MISATTISPLNRRIIDEGGGGIDPSAQAFITAAGITGETQQTALNQLVLDLKGAGSTTNNSDVWSDIHAVYPMCPINGSTATLTACSYNLKDTSAHQITWFNSPTVSINGVAGNGSNAYGDTNYNPSINAVLNDTHFTMVKSSGYAVIQKEIGVRSGGNLFSVITSGTSYLSSFYNTSTGRLTTTYNNTGKLIITSSRTSSISHSVYQNGISIGSNSTSGGALPNANFYLFAENGFLSRYDNANYEFVSIGLGLTENQAKDLDDAIQTFNTALGR